MRDQPDHCQAGIEIGHWDKVVRRRSREVSPLKTEDLTPAKRFLCQSRWSGSAKVSVLSKLNRGGTKVSGLFGFVAAYVTTQPIEAFVFRFQSRQRNLLY